MNETAALTFNDKFKGVLMDWGMDQSWTTYIADFSSLLIALFIAIIIYYIAKFIINRILKRLILRTSGKWDDYLYENRVFTRLAMLFPALVILVSLRSLVDDYPVAMKYIELFTNLYIVFIILLVISSFLNAVHQIYNGYEVSNDRPIKSYLQIAKIIFYILGGIVMVSIIMGKSPMTLLAGIGAMSAITMLVFKDSILGFVAGIQLTSNRSLKIGDWITAPKFNADGTVFDISLVSIKVRNFDNSVCILPAYSLITDSFINWRTFHEAGGRRLKRYFLVDVRSIRQVDDELIAQLKEQKFPVEQWMKGLTGPTNLGLFRNYLAHYLRGKPIINQDATLMIRQLQSAENGLPIEVYAFFNSSDWVGFEHFQAELFEHIYAMLPVFDLIPFQRISNNVAALEQITPKS